MLKKKGTVVMNTKYIPPNFAFQGSAAKPTKIDDLVGMIRKKALKVHEIDGIGIANQTRKPPGCEHCSPRRAFRLSQKTR